MSTYKEWVVEQVEDIKTGIEGPRGYESYFNVEISSEPIEYIMKMGEHNEFLLLRPDKCTPRKINRSYNTKHWRDYYTNRGREIVLWDNIIRGVIHEENSAIYKMFTENAKEVKVENTFQDLHEAFTIIETAGDYANTLVLNPSHKGGFRALHNFVSRWSLPEKLVEQQGLYFYGMLGHIHTFLWSAVEKNKGLLYDKRRSNLKMNPLDVGVDKIDDPKELHINQNIISWRSRDDSLVILNIT